MDEQMDCDEEVRKACIEVIRWWGNDKRLPSNIEFTDGTARRIAEVVEYCYYREPDK